MLLRSILVALSASLAVAQNCGPKFGNQVCAAGKCCSQYGWCDTGAAYCDRATCLSKFSGRGSSCAAAAPGPSSTTPATSTFNGPYASKVPDIDVCGSGSGDANVSCPGAGIGGFFYRCCSSAGHCGPKNDIQDPAIYCGTGCQAGNGACDPQRARPANPTGTPGVSQEGETCGPIVNKKCATGLCCSGSNFCGRTADFCGAANWCQPKWGQCSGK